VLDRVTGTLTLESVDADGAVPHADSRSPNLTADGEVIAFETLASIPRMTYAEPLHIVVRNRREAILRIPMGPDGTVPNASTSEPALSANGCAVAFTSTATNLIPGSESNRHETNVFLWRFDDGSITRVSVGSNGVPQPGGASHSPSIVADGELVAFTSTARLVPADTNSVADVYLRDLRQSRTVLVSAADGGRSADGPSYSPALSADGRYVAFTSRADNLAPNDHNDDNDIYIRDLVTETTMLVSTTAKGASANAASSRPAISADGRWIVFQSLASNLGSRPGCLPVGRDQNLLPDIYLFDRITGCVSRISGSATDEWWNASVAPAIAGSGETILFSSTHPGGDDDLSADFDLFAFTRSSGYKTSPQPTH